MQTPPGPRSSAEIRAYLRDRLNQALRRPGMFGGEMTLRLLLDHLTYAERDDAAWAEELRVLEARGARDALGVTGAFTTVVAGDYESGVASIYAEFVRDRGWLDIDRTLTTAEYASIRREVDAWVAQDRTLTEVRETFGPPSVLFGGGNALYGKTLAYATERVTQPMVFFHLWNGTDPETGPTWPPAYHEPILLAVRRGRGPFKDTFTFTPRGSMRRPGAA
ncbi:hypothetical protein [Nonomuraea cavernae]|uniref:Uncharacterized protein n=1 Tax=Nonomuraea cavernae TaxID=2045107 RepID=A0A917Z337_9ACTN|nr:hypothetical protein [Nonomuraea cavernae]MCA2187743.1 hypothetical protein [Nonomuraea cavernae]GGO71717.1 hypothetical protein GCM10012289_38050 [Nonomuraea cavernae]